LGSTSSLQRGGSPTSGPRHRGSHPSRSRLAGCGSTGGGERRGVHCGPPTGNQRCGRRPAHVVMTKSPESGSLLGSYAGGTSDTRSAAPDTTGSSSAGSPKPPCTYSFRTVSDRSEARTTCGGDNRRDRRRALHQASAGARRMHRPRRRATGADRLSHPRHDPIGREAWPRMRAGNEAAEGRGCTRPPGEAARRSRRVHAHTRASELFPRRRQRSRWAARPALGVRSAASAAFG